MLRVSTKQFNSQAPEGRILDQNPPSGVRLKSGRSVKVLLSLGERKFEVPSLVGASLRTAQLSLGQRRFTMGNTLYAHTENEPSTVAYQSPKPGPLTGTDPSVNVLISLGPLEQSFVMPDLIGKSSDAVAARARVEEIGRAHV